MADIIPFRSRFDIEAEQATATALFGNGQVLVNLGSDGGRARLSRRVARRKATASTIEPSPDDTRPSELA